MPCSEKNGKIKSKTAPKTHKILYKRLLGRLEFEEMKRNERLMKTMNNNSLYGEEQHPTGNRYALKTNQDINRGNRRKLNRREPV